MTKVVRLRLLLAVVIWFALISVARLVELVARGTRARPRSWRARARARRRRARPPRARAGAAGRRGRSAAGGSRRARGDARPRAPGRLRALGHRDRHRAVQLDHRRSARAPQHAVERGDLRASRSPRPRGVHGGDRRLHRVRPGRRRRRALDQRGPRRSAPRPTARGPARRAARARRRRRRARRAARRAAASAPAGRAPRARPASARRAAAPSRIASRAQLAPHELVAGRRRVALVEHEVHDGQHRVEPLGQLALARAPGRGCGRRGSCASRARAAAPSSAPARGRRARSPRVVSPPSVRSVSATCASAASAGWQQVKISRSRSSAMPSRRRPPSPSARSSRELRGLSVHALAAQAVDRLVARGRGEPRAGVARARRRAATARARRRTPPAPPPRRGRSRRGGGSAWRAPAGLAPEHAVDRWPGAPTSNLHDRPDLDRPCRAPGIFAAHSIASSRSLHSTR